MTQKQLINIVIVVIVTSLLGMGISLLFDLREEQPTSSLPPKIERIVPAAASIGNDVSMVGSRFTARNNSLHFGSGFAYINGLNSPDGKTIAFTLPESFDACAPAGSPCAELFSQPIPGQRYEVSVINARGRSNPISFTVSNGILPEPQPVPQPSPLECKKDSDCPSSFYVCEVVQGTGTACPDNDPSCVPTVTIERGICKLKEGSQCAAQEDCAAGFLCHRNVCTSPIGRQCSGPGDAICPANFECVQGCGSPVGYEGEPPPPYFCQLKGYVRTCPICLSGNMLIDTPAGQLPVRDVGKGMVVWTVDAVGSRAEGMVLKVSKVPVPTTHQMVRLTLDDGREILVSPGHPTANGKTVGGLVVGEWYDGAVISAAEKVSYGEGATYDILPSGETGFYWANGILLGSTLR